MLASPYAQIQIILDACTPKTAVKKQKIKPSENIGAGN